MSWFRVDDSMLGTPPWVRAIRDGGPIALLVWAKLASWSSSQQTLGVIPAGLAEDIVRISNTKAVRRALEALLQYGQLVKEDDGTMRVIGAQLETPPKPKLRRPLGNALRYRILLRDGFACRYCGARADSSVLVVDHVHPVSAGGTNDPSNLVTACEACNAGKGAKVITGTSEGG